MTTRMKGLFKGLRYMHHKYDEEQKEEEIQIGLPTDVKHVSHIGWDGPATSVAADKPSWMKDLNPSTETDTETEADSKSNQDDAEKTRRSQRAKKSQEREHHGEGTKATRRRSADNNSGDASKPRQSRRNQPKDASDGAKRTHRRKSETSDGGLRRPRNKDSGDAAPEPGDDEEREAEEKERVQN